MIFKSIAFDFMLKRKQLFPNQKEKASLGCMAIRIKIKSKRIKSYHFVLDAIERVHFLSILNESVPLTPAPERLPIRWARSRKAEVTCFSCIAPHLGSARCPAQPPAQSLLKIQVTRFIYTFRGFLQACFTPGY